MKFINFEKKKRNTQSVQRFGQALIEFALVLPLLLFILFMMIELTRVFHAYLAAENGVRQGIRYAVTGEYDRANCPGQAMDCVSESDEETARLASIKNIAYDSSSTILRDDLAGDHDPGFFQTTVCVSVEPARYIPPDPIDPLSSASCLGGDDPGDPGDLVSVTVDYNHPLIIPGLADIWPVVHIHTRREAIVEDFRTGREVSLPPVFGPTDPEPPEPPPAIEPECSKLVMLEYDFENSDFTARFRNDNLVDPQITYTRVTKSSPMSHNLHVTYLNFPFLSRGTVSYWHDTMYYNDTLEWTAAYGSGVPWPAANEALWGADFTGQKPLFGQFEAEIGFEFSNGLTCTYFPAVEVEEPEDPTEPPPNPTETDPDDPVPDETDTPTPVPPTPVPPTPTPEDPDPPDPGD
ncbi:MAG: pilus assembly protein [Anaerolineales bacterium]|nr:pilus assembly protein [Anaerolineales bacterium]